MPRVTMSEPLDSMCHALGVRGGGKAGEIISGRNHFYSHGESSLWEDLVKRGMALKARSGIKNQTITYRLTASGIRFVEHALGLRIVECTSKRRRHREDL